MLNAEILLPRFTRLAEAQVKEPPTLTDIETKLSEFNQTEIFQTWRDKIRIQIWDKVSNINNATPEQVLEANPWADVIYLLIADDSIVFLQTHDPFKEGWVAISKNKVQSISNNHADQLALESSEGTIVQELVMQLGLDETLSK
jgi:hypothetical protein